MELLIGLILLLPGLTSAALGLSWLLGLKLSERTIARLTGSCYTIATALVVVLCGWMVRKNLEFARLSLGDWFEVHTYRFPLLLQIDRLSLPLVALSVILVGVIGAFSQRYMHREAGYLRFFFLLNLFGFGVLLLFTAGSFDLMIGGWELVGLTSVLLIGFFQHRQDPVRSAQRVFLIYRICDIGLLTGVAMLHHYSGTATVDRVFTHPWPDGTSLLTGSGATVVGLLFLLAAMGKSAQVPFSGWLPQAMEGPTPSSAIFYGALSVHAGAYLLLRAQPLIESSIIVSVAVVTVGLLTAVHGTMVGRACVDAKTSIAYASMTQLGLIFAEIGFGLKWIALLHLSGHIVVRTLQFLRAPSVLHDHHRRYSAAGGEQTATGAYFELLIPVRRRAWLYRLALERGHHDTILERAMVVPLVRLAGWLQQLEDRMARALIGPARRPIYHTVRLGHLGRLGRNGQRAGHSGVRSMTSSTRQPLGRGMEGADV
jgi:NADH:ubiquinone oxidoreductase subunit 5 (subunit L)/multisubunit Na+/H+ antiporter MnhA subunit